MRDAVARKQTIHCFLVEGAEDAAPFSSCDFESSSDTETGCDFEMLPADGRRRFEFLFGTESPNGLTADATRSGGTCERSRLMVVAVVKRMID